jgi:hypothetical protein
MNPHIFVISGRTTTTLSPYICRSSLITDEYKSRIFIGDVASLTNVGGWSKSTRALHRFIGDKYTPMNIF